MDDAIERLLFSHTSLFNLLLKSANPLIKFKRLNVVERLCGRVQPFVCLFLPIDVQFLDFL
mgnify:CR=1 FL=1